MSLLIVLNILLLVWSFIQPARAGYFGAGAYLSSEQPNDREQVANLMQQLGATLERQWFGYSINPDFSGADDAVNKLRTRGIDIVGVVGSNDPKPSVSDWSAFLDQVVRRYHDRITAWEIFNEQDSMSGSDYKPYLEASYTIIKNIDSSNKVIVGGLTARSEAITFWESLYGMGGWPYFDALGLHPYRDQAPEQVRYNTGDFVNSIELAANTIRKHGGGKKIWITEFGVKNSTVGEEQQANYIIREYLLARSVPEVEKVIQYRLRDDEWGMVSQNLSKRKLFNLYQQLIPSLEGTPDPESVYVYDMKVLDGFDGGVQNWNPAPSHNTNLTLTNGNGYSGSGMSYHYEFTSGDGYAVAEKNITMDGQPTGIGLWAKGPETISNLKLRIVDAQDETFQIDMGKVTNTWRFFRFGFSTDIAKVSWGGDGRIDYPIKLDSLLYDRQGGISSGTLQIDELVALYGDNDLTAYTFGPKLVYWNGSGSATASACGKQLTFTETPQMTTVESCTRWPGGNTNATESSSTIATGDTTNPSSENSISTPSNITPSQPSFRKDKSSLSLNKPTVTADGTDAVILSVQLKNSRNRIVERNDIAVQVSGSDNVISAANFLNNDHYEFAITSTKAEQKTITVTVGNTQFDPLNITFVPGPFAADQSLLRLSSPVVNLNEEVTIELQSHDRYNNPISAIRWRLAASDPAQGLTVSEPTTENPLSVHVTTDQLGSYTFLPVIEDQEQPSLIVRLFIVPLPTGELNAGAQSVSFDSKDGKPLRLTGTPGSWQLLTLTNLSIPDDTVMLTEIQSEPTYFRLEKTVEGLISGLIQLPVEIGEHTLTIVAIDPIGKVTNLLSGTLTIGSDQPKPNSALWWWLVSLLSGCILLAGGWNWWQKQQRRQNVQT